MRALVVGASGLLGRHIARALARPGWSLRLHYHRRADEVAALAEDLRGGGVEVTTVGADLRDPSAPAALLRGQTSLDLLVYAAGLYRATPLSRLAAASIDDLWVLNARAPLLVLAAAAPALSATEGQAIWLTDIAASQPWRGHAAYGATRAAQAHALRCAALELAPRVRVNAVAPGLVRGATAVDAGRHRELEERIPAGRAAEPDEVARAVLLLAEGPATVTGQILAVDGGRLLGRRA